MDMIVSEKNVTQADGEAIVVTIINLGDGESLTVADTAELLGSSTASVRKDIERHGLVVTKCHDQNLQELKRLGLTPFKTTVVNLLPKATIQALVKIVNTPEAWAAYRQLWITAEQPSIPTVTDIFMAALVSTQGSIVDVAGIALAARDAAAAATAAILNLTDAAEDSTLTPEQIAQLSLAMSKRSSALYAGHSERRFQAIGGMKRAIKETFLPVGSRSVMTFKEIRRRDFAKALELLTTWCWGVEDGAVPFVPNRRRKWVK